MNKAIFERLQSHVFDKGHPWDIWADKSKKPNKLPYFSSWAIYGENDFEGEEVNKDDVISSLNGNIVFVALNFSSRLKSSWGPWKNIYSNKNVRWLLSGEEKSFNIEKINKYKGAYMTDLIKNIIGPVAGKVMKELDIENINKNIGWFFEEMDLLGSDCIEMYLFGNAVRNLFVNHVKNHEGYARFRKKIKKCQHIYHYSGSNNGRFRIYAPEQLGLINLSAPENKKIMKILELD